MYLPTGGLRAGLGSQGSSYTPNRSRAAGGHQGKGPWLGSTGLWGDESPWGPGQGQGSPKEWAGTGRSVSALRAMTHLNLNF